MGLLVISNSSFVKCFVRVLYLSTGVLALVFLSLFIYTKFLYVSHHWVLFSFAGFLLPILTPGKKDVFKYPDTYIDFYKNDQCNQDKGFFQLIIPFVKKP